MSWNHPGAVTPGLLAWAIRAAWSAGRQDVARAARPWSRAADEEGEIGMEHPNAALMRKVDKLLTSGDFAGFLALHTEDAVMHVPGNGPLSGDDRGRDGV